MTPSLRLPPFVTKERTRHGKIIYYFRKGHGRRIRLPYPHESTFIPAYMSALTGSTPKREYINSPRKKPTTLKWLISEYRKSAHWGSLAVNSRISFESYFDQIIRKSGDFDYRKITTKHIRSGVESRKHTPSSAIQFLTSMRVLFKWAVRQEYVAINPCLSVERPKRKTEGIRPWTKEDMQQFKSFWSEGSQPRLAFEFLLYSGLRCSDSCRAGVQHLQNNIFSIKMQKTGTIITVELPDGFMKLLAMTPIGKETFFINNDKQKMNATQFSIWFKAKATKAGVNKSAHGVRKFSATISADAGATAHELMATYGWKTVDQAETYTKGADRIRLGIKNSRRISSVVDSDDP